MPEETFQKLSVSVALCVAQSKEHRYSVCMSDTTTNHGAETMNDIETQIVNLLPATQGQLGWWIRCNSTSSYDQNLHALGLQCGINALKESGTIKVAGYRAGSIVFEAR